MSKQHWLLRVSAVLLLFILVVPAATQAQTALQTIQSEDPLVRQAGNWSTSTNAAANGGSYLVSGGSADDSLTLDFSGTYLEIVYVAAPWSGTLVVEIDGIQRRTVDTNGNYQFNQSIIFAYLSDTHHTVTIAAIAGELIAVDALITRPRRPQDPPPAGPANLLSPQATVLGETKLLATNGAALDAFGTAVAIDGERAVVGMPGNSSNGDNSGAIYIFERQPDTSWAGTPFTASDTTQFDQFGNAVGIDDDRLIVGANADQDNGLFSGSVYILDRQPDTSWAETKLKSSDGDSFDGFGNSVALDGDRALVGASGNTDAGFNSGSAYIFDRQPDGTWTETKLLASDLAEEDRFGNAVALDGNRAVVAAPSDGESGAVYVYERQPDGTWAETKLTPSDGANAFGSSVAIEDERIVVGAPSNVGAVYVFERQPDGTWAETKLTPSDGAPSDKFGASVSVQGEGIFVGAPTQGTQERNGALYIFTRQPNGSWAETKRVASDGKANDQFGYSVATDSKHVIVGAAFSDDFGDRSGSAYIYPYTLSPTDTNLLSNGDFSSGRAPWALFGDFQFEVSNGVMAFYRQFPGWQGAQLFQNVDTSFPQNAPLELKLELGNNSNTAKGVEIRLRNQAWTDSLSCSVTLPPNTPLTTVTLQGHTSQEWDNFNVTVALYDNDNTPAILVDNVNVQYRPSSGITGYDCQGFPPTANANLLDNGDFSNGRFYWALWGDFEFAVTDGVMTFYRKVGASRLANLFTEAATTIPEDRPVRLDIQIGNSSNVTKAISVILRDATWAQTFNCTFEVPANTPLTTVRVQGVTNQQWTNPFVMVRALDDDGAAAVLVDNAVVQYLPGIVVTNQCGGALSLAN